MQPPPKRFLRPTASLPTTAEHYGKQHGIPDEIQAALQNVGRKNRMLVSQGRSFDRTQSFPVFGSSSSFVPDQSNPTGFTTDREAIEHAQRVIAKDEARKHELKPYSDTVDPTSPSALQRRASPERSILGRKLKFGADGLLVDEGDMDWEGSPSKSRPAARPTLTPSRKRRTEEGNGDDGSDTDVDEDDMADDEEVPGLYDNAGSGSTVNDDFPPVFKSPQISQPELFSQPGKSFLPSRLQGGRSFKGMPGRGLGKTMSAPVGRLGGWGSEGMDVDGESAQDGFDVSEWAASENF